MQPDIGSTVSSPQGGFAFTRSYIQHVQFITGGGIVTYVNGLFVFVYGIPTILTEIVVLRDYFHPWSSNSYTLDGIVQSCVYYVPGQPEPFSPATFGVNYLIAGDPPAPSIQFDPIFTSGLPVLFDLPPAPEDYWLHFQ